MLGGIYLAYPIDQRVTSDYIADMMRQIDVFKDRLTGGPTICKWVFDPGDAFTVSLLAEPDDSLPRVNRAALNAADLVVAFLPEGVPTLGVPIEIDRARAQGKHVLVFTDIETSWMLTLPNVAKAAGWSDAAFGDAIEWIRTLDPPVVNKQHEDLRFTVDDDGMLPSRPYTDDAGLDLYTSEQVRIPPGTFRDIPTGISCELPPSKWGLVTGRSSALRTRGLLVHTGIIDNGYRGPLYAGAFNLTKHDVVIERGERVAQFIVMHNQTQYLTPVEVEQLNPSMRGTRGFGSSGA